MIRKYARKTKNADFDEATMRSAVRKVVEKKFALRRAAQEYEINFRTLGR